MNNLNRRKFLSNLTLTTAALAIPGFGYSRFSRTDDYVVADTSHGKVRGSRVEGVNIFKGIPYAGKISGDRRFRRPANLNHGQEFVMLCN